MPWGDDDAHWWRPGCPFKQWQWGNPTGAQPYLTSLFLCFFAPVPILGLHLHTTSCYFLGWWWLPDVATVLSPPLSSYWDPFSSTSSHWQDMRHNNTTMCLLLAEQQFPFYTNLVQIDLAVHSIFCMLQHSHLFTSLPSIAVVVCPAPCPTTCRTFYSCLFGSTNMMYPAAAL